MAEFPQHEIGEITGTENMYVVHWLNKDHARITFADTDEVFFEFASLNSGGFTDTVDVIDQAIDVIVDIEENQLESGEPW